MGTTSPYQCSGVESRHACSPGIGEGQTECPHPSGSDGQHLSSGIVVGPLPPLARRFLLTWW